MISNSRVCDIKEIFKQSRVHNVDNRTTASLVSGDFEISHTITSAWKAFLACIAVTDTMLFQNLMLSMGNADRCVKAILNMAISEFYITGKSAPYTLITFSVYNRGKSSNPHMIESRFLLVEHSESKPPRDFPG